MDLAMNLFESLRPWHGAMVAGAVALSVALAARMLRRPHLAIAAAGIGVLAGWWFVFGLVTASPRQLPERLPLLMLVLAPALPLAVRLAARRSWAAWPLAVSGALWVGWWMAGAPLVGPDLRRAAPVLTLVTLATLLLAAGAGSRWSAPLAGAALLAGLVAAGLPGPQPFLGAALLAAAVATALVPLRGSPPHPALAALPVAAAIVALASVPVLARGMAADWAAAAAPFAALWIGAPVGARLAGRGGAVVGALLAGGSAAAMAWTLR